MPSSASYKLGALVLFYRHRFFSSNPSQGYHGGASLSSKLGYGSFKHQGLRLINANNGVFEKPDTNILKDDKYKVQPPPVPGPTRPSFPVWVKWFLGSILSVLLPFWKQKWEKLLLLEGTVEKVVEEVENIAEVVEKVATTAEKVSAEVADKLPENGKLKETALMVEHISTITAKDAQLTNDLIHKVDNLKQDLKDLETILEPVIDKIVEVEHAEK